MINLKYDDFPKKSYDKIRYGDTDKQGHVNNSVFSTLYETGRIEILQDEKFPLYNLENSFAIANLNIDYIEEIKWPGIVEIGTLITKIGNSSITFYQHIYQNNVLVSKSTSVIVQVDNKTKKSKRLGDEVKKILGKYTFDYENK